MTEKGDNFIQSARVVERNQPDDGFRLNPLPTHKRKFCFSSPQAQQQQPPLHEHKRGSSTHALIAPKSEGAGYVCLWIGCTFKGTFVSLEELNWHLKTQHVRRCEGQTAADRGVGEGVVGNTNQG